MTDKKPDKVKRPAFQFYPADWRKDAELQSCSIAARGLWHEMLCVMHECDPYGYLMVAGKPMTMSQLARLVGITARECQKLVAEIEKVNVFSRAENGAIFSRRMVKDEETRAKRAAGGPLGEINGIEGAEHGKKGGRPRKNGGLKTPLPDGGADAKGGKEPPIKPPPSSSSSSSSSESPLPPQGGGGAAPSSSEVKARVADLIASPSITQFNRVEAWLAQGADPVLDIYPAVQAGLAKLAANGQTLRSSLVFFDTFVADAIAVRTKPLPAGSSAPKFLRMVQRHEARGALEAVGLFKEPDISTAEGKASYSAWREKREAHLRSVGIDPRSLTQ